MTQVVVVIEDGVVQNVVADERVEVTIIDYDMEGDEPVSFGRWIVSGEASPRKVASELADAHARAALTYRNRADAVVEEALSKD